MTYNCRNRLRSEIAAKATLLSILAGLLALPVTAESGHSAASPKATKALMESNSPTATKASMALNSHTATKALMESKSHTATNMLTAPRLSTRELVFLNVTKTPAALNDIQGAHDFKSWKPSERAAIERVYSKLPREFRENAIEAAGGPIVLVRATSKDNHAYASAKFNTICIYDSALDKWKSLDDAYLTRILAHELGHVVDFAQRYSFSTEWLKLLHPKILRYTRQIGSNDSINDKSHASIENGFAQVPDDYAETMCCLNASIIAHDDYYKIEPDVANYLHQKFLRRNKLTLDDQKKRALWKAIAKLEPADHPDHLAAVRLAAKNDSESWFYPIDFRRTTGLYDTHKDTETFSAAKVELQRLNHIGLDDTDPFKNDVLLSLGRLACRINKLDEAKGFFAKACPNGGDALLAAYNNITPYEDYRTTLVLYSMLMEAAPDKIPDYFAEADALIRIGDITGAINALQRSHDYLTKNKKNGDTANSLAAQKACLLYDTGKVEEAQKVMTEVMQYDKAHQKEKSWFVTQLGPSILNPGSAPSQIKCPIGLGRIIPRGSKTPIGFMKVTVSQDTNQNKQIKAEIHWDDFSSVPINNEICTGEGKFEGVILKDMILIAGDGACFNRLRIVSPTELEFFPSTQKVAVLFGHSDDSATHATMHNTVHTSVVAQHHRSSDGGHRAAH